MGIPEPSGGRKPDMTRGLWPQVDEGQLGNRGQEFAAAASELGGLISDWAQRHHMMFNDNMWSGSAAGGAQHVSQGFLDQARTLHSRINSAADWYRDADETVRSVKDSLDDTANKQQNEINKRQNVINKLQNDIDNGGSKLTDQDMRDLQQQIELLRQGIEDDVVDGWNENSDTVTAAGNKLGLSIDVPAGPPRSPGVKEDDDKLGDGKSGSVAANKEAGQGVTAGGTSAAGTATNDDGIGKSGGGSSDGSNGGGLVAANAAGSADGVGASGGTKSGAGTTGSSSGVGAAPRGTAGGVSAMTVTSGGTSTAASGGAGAGVQATGGTNSLSNGTTTSNAAPAVPATGSTNSPSSGITSSGARGPGNTAPVTQATGSTNLPSSGTTAGGPSGAGAQPGPKVPAAPVSSQSPGAPSAGLGGGTASGGGGGSSGGGSSSPMSGFGGGGGQGPQAGGGAPSQWSDVGQQQGVPGQGAGQPGGAPPVGAPGASAASAASGLGPAVLPASAGMAEAAATSAASSSAASATPVEQTGASAAAGRLAGHVDTSGLGGSSGGLGSMGGMVGGLGGGGGSPSPGPLGPPPSPAPAAPVGGPGSGASGAGAGAGAGASGSGTGTGTPGGPGVHAASAMNPGMAGLEGPAPVPVSAARAERDALAAVTSAGALRRQQGGDALVLARRIAAALNAPDMLTEKLRTGRFYWLVAVCTDGTIVAANSYGIGFIPEGIELPERVRMASADATIPAVDRARWATYPVAALQGWASAQELRLRAVIGTADQFAGTDPGAAKIVLESDDIPPSGKMRGRDRLLVAAPTSAATLAATGDLALLELLPPAPAGSEPPADKRNELWFELIKPLMSAATDRGSAHLRAFITYTTHLEQLAVYQAHTAIHAQAQRAAVADWMYWHHLSGLLAEALAEFPVS